MILDCSLPIVGYAVCRLSNGVIEKLSLCIFQGCVFSWVTKVLLCASGFSSYSFHRFVNGREAEQCNSTRKVASSWQALAFVTHTQKALDMNVPSLCHMVASVTLPHVCVHKLGARWPVQVSKHISCFSAGLGRDDLGLQSSDRWLCRVSSVERRHKKVSLCIFQGCVISWVTKVLLCASGFSLRRLDPCA